MERIRDQQRGHLWPNDWPGHGWLGYGSEALHYLSMRNQPKSWNNLLTSLTLASHLKHLLNGLLGLGGLDLSIMYVVSGSTIFENFWMHFQPTMKGLVSMPMSECLTWLCNFWKKIVHFLPQMKLSNVYTHVWLLKAHIGTQGEIKSPSNFVLGT